MNALNRMPLSFIKLAHAHYWQEASNRLWEANRERTRHGCSDLYVGLCELLDKAHAKAMLCEAVLLARSGEFLLD